MSSLLHFLENCVFNKLNEREKRVIFLRQKQVFGFGENQMTLTAIAKQEGVSPGRMVQIVAKGIRKVDYRLHLIAESQKSPHVIIREVTEKQTPNLPMRIKHVDDLGELSVRTRNCLISENVQQVDDLLNATKWDLLRVPNFGKKSLRELEGLLAQHGLKLKDSRMGSGK